MLAAASMAAALESNIGGGSLRESWLVLSKEA